MMPEAVRSRPLDVLAALSSSTNAKEGTFDQIGTERRWEGYVVSFPRRRIMQNRFMHLAVVNVNGLVSTSGRLSRNDPV